MNAKATAPVVLRSAALLAIAFSTALLIDYAQPAPLFCDAGGGCEAVRRTGLGAVAGPVLPLFGLLGFCAVFAASLARSARARALAIGASAVAGLTGAFLLLLQAFVIHAFCKLCVVVDLSALVLAASAAAWWKAGLANEEALPRLCWLSMASAAVLGPLAWSMALAPAGVPRGIAALAEPGVVVVVEFSDFECPFCRMAHPELKAALATAPERTKLIRKVLPLTIHPHARDAARAYVCAAKQNKADAMADALFASDDLSPPGCEAAARAVGVDAGAYSACLADPATNEAVDRDSAFVRDASFKGLPTVWVGTEAVVGAVKAAEYSEALHRAVANPEGGRRGRGLVAIAAVVLMTAGLFWLGWRRRQGESTLQTPSA